MTKPKKEPGNSGGKKFPVLPVIGAIVAIIVVAAVVFAGAPGQEFGEVTIEGTPLAQFSAQSDPAVGQIAPEVTGIDFDGNEVAIRHDGTPKAVLFLAHWCPHCRNEVPAVQSWLDATGGVEGVEIISVSTSMNSAQPNFPPSSWLEGEGWGQAVIRDDVDSSVWSAYGAGGFPYWVFLDGNGTVMTRSAGEIDITSLEQLLVTMAALETPTG